MRAIIMIRVLCTAAAISTLVTVTGAGYKWD